MSFQGFRDFDLETEDGVVHAAVGGSGPPLLLLHGFPQTHLMWRDVAPLLAKSFSLVCADLPGQGGSGPAAGHVPDPYSKRAMAGTLVQAMAQLSHQRFGVVGHDRGARVAYRMALDHRDAVDALAVLDVVPILDALECADDRTLLSFWPWSLMSQPAPLPERLVGAAPDAVIEDSVEQWGTPASVFPEEVRAAYASALGDPRKLHAICEEFRAAGTVDRDHDAADRKAGLRITQPTLVLWDREGALSRWYADAGGPLAIWRAWAPGAQGEPVPGGHFFPEAESVDTARRLRDFFAVL